jgi:hypothetical protein
MKITFLFLLFLPLSALAQLGRSDDRNDYRRSDDRNDYRRSDDRNDYRRSDDRDHYRDSRGRNDQPDLGRGSRRHGRGGTHGARMERVIGILEEALRNSPNNSRWQSMLELARTATIVDAPAIGLCLDGYMAYVTQGIIYVCVNWNPPSEDNYIHMLIHELAHLAGVRNERAADREADAVLAAANTGIRVRGPYS